MIFGFDTRGASGKLPPIMRFLVTAYPWDLVDENLDVVLDRLHGDVGVAGLSLWTATPPVLALRVAADQPRVIRSDGGLLFHADRAPYSATRCQPLEAPGSTTGNRIARIIAGCAQRDMPVRAVVSASRLGRLPKRHPEMCCKNVFGIESQAVLCLGNPDVAAFLVGLVSELSGRWPLSAVVVRDFDICWVEAFSADLRTPPLGEVGRWLLSLCFCESCRQRAGEAGVDVESACRSVAKYVVGSMETSGTPSESSATAVSDDPSLAAFLRWRGEELSRLLVRLVDSCGCDLLLDRGGIHERHEASDEPVLTAPAGVVTKIESAEALASAAFPAARRNELRLPLNLTAGVDGPTLVSLCSRAVESGFDAVEIDDFASLPESAMTPIKQAARFARRATTAR